MSEPRVASRGRPRGKMRLRIARCILRGSKPKVWPRIDGCKLSYFLEGTYATFSKRCAAREAKEFATINEHPVATSSQKIHHISKHWKL